MKAIRVYEKEIYVCWQCQNHEALKNNTVYCLRKAKLVDTKDKTPPEWCPLKKKEEE